MKSERLHEVERIYGENLYKAARRGGTKDRIRCAVHALIAGTAFDTPTHQRAYDDCFENGDGDAVLVGVVNRAEHTPELASAIVRQAHYLPLGLVSIARDKILAKGWAFA